MLEKIRTDMKNAMKSGDKLRVSVLRMLASDIKNERIKKGGDPTEEECIALLKSAVKKRKESAEQFDKGGRRDLAEKEEREIRIVEEYLPEQLTREETEEIADKAVEELGAVGMQDMGKVMGTIMKEYKSVVDGNVLKEIVARKLSG